MAPPVRSLILQPATGCAIVRYFIVTQDSCWTHRQRRNVAERGGIWRAIDLSVGYFYCWSGRRVHVDAYGVRVGNQDEERIVENCPSQLNGDVPLVVSILAREARNQ